MKIIFVAFFVTYFAASLAYKTLPEETASLTELDADSKAVAEEANLVGQILCDVARELENEESLGIKVDEYFFKKLFGKAKKAVKTLGAKAIEKAGQVVKKKIEEKATKVVSDLFRKALGRYTLHDSESGAGIVKYLCLRMSTAGRRLIQQGEQLRSLYDVSF